MPLELEYVGQTTVPVEVEGLIPSAVRGQSLAEVERFKIFHGNQQLPLAEYFRVRGDTADDQMVFSGNLAGVHWVGAKLDGGTIRVEGDVGRHLGSEMTAGEIRVSGSAGDWVGGEMHGGFIVVRGRAGHLIGAAYRGSPKGMTSGTIFIGGDVGNEVGHTMRRGLIVVGGSCGDFAALNMIAGSVFVFGKCGIRPAAGMRRGTLALFGDHPPLLPTFRAGGIVRPAFMRMYLLQVHRLGFDVPPEALDADYHLFHGDLVTVGRGEVLMRVN